MAPRATKAPPPELAASPPCPMQDETDMELIQQFLAGEEAAFDRLLLRHQQRAFSIAYGLVGSYEDAAEVAQDAFVKVYYAAEKFRGDSSFPTWLYRIVANLARNRVRHLLSRGKGRSVPLEDAEPRLSSNVRTAEE